MRRISEWKASGPAGPVYWYCVPAFFSVWAILRAGQLSTRSMLGPTLFVLCTWFFAHAAAFATEKSAQEANPVKIRRPGGRADGRESDAMPVMGGRAAGGRVRCAAILLAALFTLFTLAAQGAFLTDGLENRVFQGVILVACGAGFFFLFYFCLLFVLCHAGAYTMKAEERPLKRLPLFCFLFCLLCWLPYFLYEFPGIMTPDSVNQFEQVLKMVPYSNHHPFVHTLLMGLLYRLGRLFTTDVTAALSFFTVFQMVLMAAAASYLTATLQRLGVRNGFCLLTAAFYALVPYNAVFAVTLWKDVLFSGAVLFFSVTLARILLLYSGMKRPERVVTLTFYVLSGVSFCLLRSNGWYAFLLTFPFLLYAFRHSLKRMLPLTLCILGVALLVRGPVMNACKVTQPDFVESVCIPLQQVSRVLYEGRALTGEEWELVHRVMDTTYIRELYAPGFADNMKELVRAGNPQYLAEHKGAYLKLWLSLGLRYPGDYLRAYIDQTVGYWYPDVAYPVADIDGVIENDTGVVSRPLIGGPLVVKAKEILLKLGNMLPLYGLIFSMGALFWTLLVCVAITWVKGVAVKEPAARYLLFLPGLAVILTLLIATPVSGEFRYAYSLAYALPFYLALVLQNYYNR